MNPPHFAIGLPNRTHRNTHTNQLYEDPIVFRKPVALDPTNPNLLPPFLKKGTSPLPSHFGLRRCESAFLSIKKVRGDT
ncbi:hypothetical protein LguiA_030172 [Lonicera macranthoides]